MQKPIPTTVRNHAKRTHIPPDVPKMRQAARSTSPPSVLKHLALAAKEREQLQAHLNLVGIDKYRFQHIDSDQGQLHTSHQENNLEKIKVYNPRSAISSVSYCIFMITLRSTCICLLIMHDIV